MQRMDLHVRAMRRFGRTRLFGVVMPVLAPPVDRLAHRLSGGRLRVGQLFLPTLMLTTMGRRSGQPRATPVAYVREGDGFALLATNFGKPDHPAWSANLLAQPDALVTVDGGPLPVRARLAEGAERDRLWRRFNEVWPAYETYVQRSGRTPRMFVLEPRA